MIKKIFKIFKKNPLPDRKTRRLHFWLVTVNGTPGHIVNLSKTGMRVKLSSRDTMLNNTVTVDINTPYGHTSVEGNIKWINPTSNHIGIQFNNKSENGVLELLIDSEL